MSIACPHCANQNPPDHFFCHQCGSRLGVESAYYGQGAEPTVPRRLPDESRMPPRGSFRSGLYRLIRAVLINQRPLASPSNNGTATNSGRVETVARVSPTRSDAATGGSHSEDPSLRTAEGGQSAAQEPFATPTAVIVSDEVSARMPAAGIPTGSGVPVKAAEYWLARAFLVRHSRSHDPRQSVLSPDTVPTERRYTQSDVEQHLPVNGPE